MPRWVTLLLALSLFTLPVLSQDISGKPDVKEDGFVAQFPSGGLLHIHVRSGAVRIVGGEEDKITIQYAGKNWERAREVKVSFKKSGQNGDLTIKGGPRNEFEVRIQVPHQTHLQVRMPFGDLEVTRVVGNKDVEVHAGDVTLELGEAKQYAHVDASVTTGDLTAEPFNVNKGGLFRSFKTQGAGLYNVHAHVGAGDLTLKN
jgi:hypothetical protein